MNHLRFATFLSVAAFACSSSNSNAPTQEAPTTEPPFSPSGDASTDATDAADGGKPDGPATTLPSGSVDPTFGASGVTEGTGSYWPAIGFSKGGQTAIIGHRTVRNAEVDALLATGAPDTTNGPQGRASVQIPGTVQHSEAIVARAVPEESGAVLVFGSMRAGSPTTPFVCRITNGALDPSFGSGGMWTFGDLKARVTTVQPSKRDGAGVDGYYVMVAMSSLGDAAGTPREASRRVYHLSASGVTDPAFADGKGYFEVRGAFDSDVDGGVLVDASGSPIVFARPDGPLLVRRLTVNGTLDMSWGIGGVAVISYDIETPFVTSSVAPASGGLLVTLGRTSFSSVTRFARLDAAGEVADVFPGERSREVAGELHIGGELSAGRLALLRVEPTTGYAIGIERWLADGKPDTGFGQEGKVAIGTVAGEGQFLGTVGTTSSGATMVGTITETTWSVHRLTP